MSSRGVALVTGSGKRRIGWHVADALAQRGYALAIHYHHSPADAAETVASFQARGVEVVAIQATLVQHEGSPRNIAQAVLFFMDNDFVTGVCLPVDGGRTVFAPE